MSQHRYIIYLTLTLVLTAAAGPSCPPQSKGDKRKDPPNANKPKPKGLKATKGNAPHGAGVGKKTCGNAGKSAKKGKSNKN